MSMSEDKNIFGCIEASNEENSATQQQNIISTPSSMEEEPRSSSVTTPPEDYFTTTSDVNQLSEQKIFSPPSVGSTSVLQDLLRDHTSEIGNWCEIVSNHQDDPTSIDSAATELSSVEIAHNGPFYILVTNFFTGPLHGCDPNKIIYNFFGGSKKLYAVYIYQKPRFTDAQLACMLMAKTFESCVDILKMEGMKSNDQPFRLEYVISDSNPLKTHHFTASQLDAQMSNYRNIHPLEVRPKTDPFGNAKPVDTAGILERTEKKIREEKEAEIRRQEKEREKSEREKEERHQMNESEKQRQFQQIEKNRRMSDAEKSISSEKPMQPEKGRNDRRTETNQDRSQKVDGNFPSSFNNRLAEKRSDVRKDGFHKHQTEDDNNPKEHNQRHGRRGNINKLKESDSQDSTGTKEQTSRTTESRHQNKNKISQQHIHTINSYISPHNSNKSNSATTITGSTKSDNGGEDNGVHRQQKKEQRPEIEKYPPHSRPKNSGMREFRRNSNSKEVDQQQYPPHQQQKRAWGRGKFGGTEKQRGWNRDQKNEGASRKNSSTNVKEGQGEEKTEHVAEGKEFVADVKEGLKERIEKEGKEEQKEGKEEDPRKEGKEDEGGWNKEEKRKDHQKEEANVTTAASSSAIVTISETSEAASSSSTAIPNGHSTKEENVAVAPNVSKKNQKKKANRKSKNNSNIFSSAGGNRFSALSQHQQDME